MRVKGGTTTRKRHKKILKRAKGYRMSYHKTYRRAHEAYMHAGMYSYKDRKKRKSQFRKLWIIRISAALHGSGLSYSQFIHELKDKNIGLNRKILSQLAIHQPKVFERVLETAQK